MFPTNSTKVGKLKNKKLYKLSPNERAYLIGNALVTGIVKKIGKELSKKLISKMKFDTYLI